MDEGESERERRGVDSVRTAAQADRTTKHILPESSAASWRPCAGVQTRFSSPTGGISFTETGKGSPLSSEGESVLWRHRLASRTHHAFTHQGTLAVSESRASSMDIRINPRHAGCEGTLQTMRVHRSEGEFGERTAADTWTRMATDDDDSCRYYSRPPLAAVFDSHGAMWPCSTSRNRESRQEWVRRAKADVLYVTNGDKIFRRKVQATGNKVAAAKL